MDTPQRASDLPEREQVLGRFLGVQHPPLVPEIRLWLVAGHVDLNARCQELLAGGHVPYWAFCWGSGQALARYLLDHPERVAGRRVVDFGAGSGVVGIAAVRAGAAQVTSVDLDPKALHFCRLNAELNGVSLDTARETPRAWDVLFASDVLYEQPLLRWLQAQAGDGRDVIIADPGRPGAPRLTQEPLAWIEEARTFPDVDYPMCRAALHLLEPGDPPHVSTETARGTPKLEQP